MAELAAWCGAVGAWLLLAGPILQAAVELDDVAIDREELFAVLGDRPAPARPSPLWWLLPPVGYLLQRRFQRRVREALLGAMTREQVERLIEFTDKATGWLLVAGGAFLIAVTETWHLVAEHRWPVAVFWVAVVVMPTLSAAYTAARMQRSKSLLASKEPATG
jgi:hypothetical protein